MFKGLKIEVVIILIIGIVTIGYFGLSNGDEKGKDKIVIPDEEIEERKKQVAHELFEDFKIRVQEIEKKEQDNYEILVDDVVIASGKTHALDIYKWYLGDDERNWYIEKKVEVRNRLEGFSTVYFGYTKSGLEIIVLATPTMTNNFYYSSVMDKIRNDDNITNLLFEIGRIRVGSGISRYYTLDVYVKDLLEYREEFEIEISISFRGDTYYPINDIENDQIDAILAKYNRNLDDTNIIKNEQWKLYLFDEELGWPLIKIRYEGEEVILEN